MPASSDPHKLVTLRGRARTIVLKGRATHVPQLLASKCPVPWHLWPPYHLHSPTLHCPPGWPSIDMCIPTLHLYTERYQVGTKKRTFSSWKSTRSSLCSTSSICWRFPKLLYWKLHPVLPCVPYLVHLKQTILEPTYGLCMTSVPH